MRLVEYDMLKLKPTICIEVQYIISSMLDKNKYPGITNGRPLMQTNTPLRFQDPQPLQTGGPEILSILIWGLRRNISCTAAPLFNTTPITGKKKLHSLIG